jgi:hypothetical protein
MKKPYVKPTINTYEAVNPEHCGATTGPETRQLEQRSERRSLHDDWRFVPRYPFSANALILEPVNQIRRTAKISEISTGGCYVEGLEEFGKFTVLRILIIGTSGSFETWATVAYVQRGTGTGVQFCETQPTQQRVVDGWVAELEAFLD